VRIVVRLYRKMTLKGKWFGLEFQHARQ
jgi:hypothetical protein